MAEDTAARKISHESVGRILGQCKLPTEILTKIFGFISGKQTLQNIALCCHHFRHVVAPILFRNIYIPCGYLEPHITPKSLTRGNALRGIALKFLRTQSYAHFVHHLELYAPSDKWYSPTGPGGDEVDFELQKAVQHYVRNSENASTKLVQIGTNWLTFTFEDPVTPLVLLLACLPCLKSLHLQITSAQLLADGILSLNVFTGLEQMILEWTSPNVRAFRLTELREGHLKDLLSIPTLRKACVIRLASYPVVRNNNSIFDIVSRRSSSITHLELRESRLFSRDPVPLLAAFKSLKTFIYEQSWKIILGRRFLRPSPVLSALHEFHKGTLESLWLDFSRHSIQKQIPLDRAFFQESTLRLLSDFEYLRHVCLPMEFMFQYAPPGMWNGAALCFPPLTETIVLINHTNTWFCPLSSFGKEFFEFLQNARADYGTDFSNGILSRLRTVVLIAPVDQFLHCSPNLFEQLENVPGLNVILACDGHQLNEYEDPVAEDIQAIEALMGLTNVGKRWQCLSKITLRHGCEHYERLREQYGQFDAYGELNTPEVLRRKTRST